MTGDNLEMTSAVLYLLKKKAEFSARTGAFRIRSLRACLASTFHNIPFTSLTSWLVWIGEQIVTKARAVSYAKSALRDGLGSALFGKQW